MTNTVTSPKTYHLAACASGCAFHTTLGGTCSICGGALTEPQALTREQARAVLLGGERYDQGKAAVVAWLKSRAS